MRILSPKAEANVIAFGVILAFAGFGIWYTYIPPPTAAEEKENLRVFCEWDWTGSSLGVQEAVLSMCERASPDEYTGVAKT